MIQWGKDAARRMFWFLQSQAAVGIVLALSIVLAAQNPNPNLRVQDWIGLLILLAAIVGEAIADHQLRAFKSDPTNRNAICDVGLWRWSRHPNYFFEWLSWLAYPIIALDFAGHNPYGWLSLACAHLHVLDFSTCIRHPAARRPYAALSRRSIPRLSEANPRLPPITIEVMKITDWK